ncbi:MAG: prolyl oligopeptidase family serine peptidase [Gemmatimonadota bacterium]|nr:prolyl oligopeptidase family serine peptidase [Gemmatimonadota bacterium]
MLRLTRQLNLLAAVSLPPLLLACGDSGSPTPTGPPVPQNRSPAVSAQVSDQIVEEGTEVQVDISAAFSDPDGDILAHGVASNAPSVAQVTVSGSDVTVSGIAPGTATVTLAATDPGGLSAALTFVVTVTAANRAPTVSAQITDQIVEEGAEVRVDISEAFTDPDGDDLTYDAISDAQDIAVASVSGSEVTVSGVTPETTAVTVTATDPGGLGATQAFTVTVTAANRAPTVSAQMTDQSVEEGAEVQVDISEAFSDPDGDDLTYDAISDAQDIAVASVSGSEVTVSGVAPGTTTITLIATDPGRLTASQTFSVTVKEAEPDLDALFSAPTPAEIAQVEVEWATRTPEVSGVRLELDTLATLPLAGTLRVRVFSHTVGGIRHYGVVVTPAGARPGSLPVVLYTHGGDTGVALAEIFLINTVLQPRGLSAAIVAPSYRAEPVEFTDRKFLSEGPPSPWDRDVDDALSLLSVALEEAVELDGERIAVLGISRGGGVGLLAAARDPRIDAVVEFFGPTDFFGEYAREIFEEALAGELRPVAGLKYLNEALIQPWIRGELSDAAGRLELVRRSAAYFVGHMPPVQLHHGEADEVVAVSQAERLIEAMREAGKTEGEFEAHVYPGGVHDPFALPGAPDRAAEFLESVLGESW